MTEKRFTTDNGNHEDVCLVDNLTKKEYESNFGDIVSLMNDIWNQTQRFEKHNQRLEKENEKLKDSLNFCKENVKRLHDDKKELINENEQLKQSYIQLKHRHSLLHDECLDAECDRDSYQKDVSSLEKENEQLKQEIIHWKKILDNHQQIVAKTLREQYHWLKNEDKIQNNDKTVALLELEAISNRLGIDLN